MKTEITLLLLAAALILLSGCPQPVPQPPGKDLCLGKANIADAVRVLNLQRQNVRPFKSGADCIVYFPDNEGRLKPESVDAVQIRFLPPDKVFFRGDKAFGEIRLGTNETEFWLRIKPELDSYWYGSRSLAANCTAGLPVNPANIAEAFGVVNVTNDWKLTYRDGYDLLDYEEDGIKKKRIYVDACTYLISRIEYFDRIGGLKASANLTDYTTGENGIVVPGNIYVANYDERGLEDTSIEIKLKHVAPFTPTEKQLEKMFARPPRDGYKNMYKLNEYCEFELIAE